MHAFQVLTRDQQQQAIRRLAALGWSEHGIAHATQLSTEQIRRVLAEREEATRVADMIHDDANAEPAVSIRSRSARRRLASTE
jgi:ABC-type phosphate/phosphonate transport system ATPase subunit